MRGHVLYVGIVVTGSLMAPGAGLFGAEYRLMPLKERLCHPRYEIVRLTGLLGQGYGVVGASMIILGVSLYSARKRIRVLPTFGTSKQLLESHIFLCLTGPLLVIYHTTFKCGGLVAVSAWNMAAVLLSGLMGRYLKSFEARLRARRIALLEKPRVLFHHWHVVHMPFRIFMFLLLLIHIAVAIAPGYRRVF